MKQNIKQLLLRVLMLLIGLTVAHLGVTLFLLADLGADPFNVCVQGVFRSMQKIISHPLLTHGNVHVCISLMIILILLIVDRSYVRIGTLLCMILGGPIIDVFSLLLSPLFQTMNSLPFKLVMLALGCVILAMGMSLVIKSNAGTGPNDLVAVVISDKSKAKFSIIRVAVDFSFIAMGWLLGGSVGIGTVICAFLVGPVAGFFLPKSEKLVHWALEKSGL
ncbi:MAG: hypothetical protein Q4C54_10295 [Clostridia bacterium]|nr:hypothetical protein [Clostridia bacterium]